MKINFGKRLEELIEENNINKNNFAKRLNISHQQVSNYIKDNSHPSLERLLEIANYFNVSVDYLLGLSNIRNEKSELISELKNNEEIYNLVKKTCSNKYYKLVKDLIEDDTNIRIMKILVSLNPKTKEKIAEMLESLKN